MNWRMLMAVAVLPVVVGIAWVAPVSLQAQSSTAARTPWGDPDLQGLWTNTTTTPMERPDDLSGQDTLSSEERAARDTEVAEAVSFDNISEGNVGAYNEFWVERGVALANFFLTFSGGPNSRLVERFTPQADGTLDYRFTVTDPSVDTSEWTAAIPMRRSEDTLFEYACHEGNYAMPNILAGARADEAKAAEEQSR